MEPVVTKRFRSFVVCVAVVGVLTVSASADRGSIRNVKRINVEEPAQRAIIAYNGVREVLILQTDVRAAEETKVVEFMPLPSKPDVSLAPEGCFAELAKIVRKHNLRYYAGRQRTGRDGKAGIADAAVKVVVAAQLGPHAVTVVEVKDADAFVTWVKDFFRKNDLGKPDLTGELRGVVSDYLNRKIRFFAFDIVTMSPEKKTVRPLTYSFESERLYYPLKVTNLYGGRGVVELFVILPKRFERRQLGDPAFIQIYWSAIRRVGATQRKSAEAIEKEALKLEALKKKEAARDRALLSRRLDQRTMRSNIVTLAADELRALHRDIPALTWGEGAHMIAVRYEGPLHFDADVEGALGFTSSTDAARAFFLALRTGDSRMLPTLVAVPFAFDGTEIVNDKTALIKRFERVLAKPLGRPGTQPEVVQMPIGSYRFVLNDAFSRRFVEQHLLKRRAAIIGLTLDGEEARIFVRRDAYRTWRVVGFRD